MYATLTIRDATTLKVDKDHSFTLDFPKKRITAKELIRARVYQEVQEYNKRSPEYFRGLVQPAGAQPTPSGFRLRQGSRIDPEQQYHRALDAFERNGFLLLVDGSQVVCLGEFIEIRPDTVVTFFKLMPLVGG